MNSWFKNRRKRSIYVRTPRIPHPSGIMTAKDLFHEQGIQLFDRKTGEWIRTVYTRDYNMHPIIEEITPEEQPVIESKQQLSLF